MKKIKYLFKSLLVITALPTENTHDEDHDDHEEQDHNDDH